MSRWKTRSPGRSPASSPMARARTFSFSRTARNCGASERCRALKRPIRLFQLCHEQGVSASHFLAGCSSNGRRHKISTAEFERGRSDPNVVQLLRCLGLLLCKCSEIGRTQLIHLRLNFRVIEGVCDLIPQLVAFVRTPQIGGSISAAFSSLQRSALSANLRSSYFLPFASKNSFMNCSTTRWFLSTARIRSLIFWTRSSSFFLLSSRRGSSVFTAFSLPNTVTDRQIRPTATSGPLRGVGRIRASPAFLAGPPRCRRA